VLCRELGIGIVPYSPLGRGVFGGKGITEKFEEGDYRSVSIGFYTYLGTRKCCAGAMRHWD